MSYNAPFPHWYEQTAWHNNRRVCGVDEVGRGCLAGPLLTAAVILPAHCDYPLYDSKKMTPKARETAYEWLIKNSEYALAWADHTAIADYNIYQATKRAMRIACIQLAHSAPRSFSLLDYIVVDAMPLTLPSAITPPPIVSFIKGEDNSCSIAAASILAKVTRDRFMKNIARQFPQYAFGQDKAYATPPHSKKLREQGATFIHRHHFITTVRTPKEKVSE